MILVVLNIVALPGHKKVMLEGHLGDRIELSSEIRYSLTHSEGLYHTVPSAVDNNAVYHALTNYLVPAFDLSSRVPHSPDFLLGPKSFGPPIKFLQEFGGNVDSRFLNFKASHQQTEDRRSFFGVANGQMETRLTLTVNRLQGEAIVRRVDRRLSESMAADFAIYAQPNATTRYERWSQRIVIPAGKSEMVVPYAIDSSHMPSTFIVAIPSQHAGKMVAGWRNPTITDTGGDSADPAWFYQIDDPIILLNEIAQRKLFAGDWRPAKALMRGGRITESGIELLPGGEIWLHVSGLVSNFSGVATFGPGKAMSHAPGIQAYWYKAGRLQTYTTSTQSHKSDRSVFFNAWCGEPDGWLVIAMEPSFVEFAAVIRVSEVKTQ